jgi:intracellular sulfur oxidation DsrE/DsrF family protein
MKSILKLAVVALFGLSAMQAIADDDSFAPGGTAIDHSKVYYKNLKIVMDLKAKDINAVKYATMVATRVLDHPGAKLAVVIEGPFVTVFAKKNYLDHQGIVDKWAALAGKGVQVEFCGNSIHSMGLKPSDMEGLDEKTPAVVNSGAYPTIAHYESLGYNLIIPIQMPESPEKK